MHKPKTILTQKQEFAIEAFAKIHGRTWKSVLRDAWMSGNYPYGSDSASLQQVRNYFGPSWLAKFKLPNSNGKARILETICGRNLVDQIGAQEA